MGKMEFQSNNRLHLTAFGACMRALYASLGSDLQRSLARTERQVKLGVGQAKTQMSAREDAVWNEDR
jgi:hypothetical protein